MALDPTRREFLLSLDGIGAECEAFLHGRMVQYLAARGRSVPAWAWLNQLAHATEAELRARASYPPGWSDNGAWLDAVALLARELLDEVAATGSSLADLQWDLLIPTELQLLAADPLRGPDPSQLVTLVLGALGPPQDRGR